MTTATPSERLHSAAPEATHGSHDADAAERLHALIGSRRSVRRYRPDAVPPALVQRLIEAAIWAPSAHNRQPWRFAPLDAPSADRLAHAMATRLVADRTADGDEPSEIAADVARSVARINGAPVVLLVCLTLADMDGYPDGRRTAAERVMAVQSTAMAMQNLWLAANAYGLGVSWMCAPLFCPEVVAATLGLPADFEPQALLTIGWPDGSVKGRARKPVEDVLWTPPQSEGT